MISILLDLDGTALMYNEDGTPREHPKLKELLSKYRVKLYSAREDIEAFAKKWHVDYVWKGDNHIPKADILIDDSFENFLDWVDVKKAYKSIDAFLRSESLKKKRHQITGKNRKNH